MGFIGWLRRIAGGAVHDLADVVHLVRTGLAGLWHVLGNLGGSVGRAWRRFTGAISWLASWIEQFAGVVAVRIRHILLVVIPHAITHTLAAAARYALRLANDLRSWARSALTYLRQQLARAINAVESWARQSVSWLTRHLADAVSTLTRTARRVWSLLDAPEHLAAWLVGAMVSALLRYARRNVVALGRWVIRSSARAVVESAPTVEDWIARII